MSAQLNKRRYHCFRFPFQNPTRMTLSKEGGRHSAVIRVTALLPTAVTRRQGYRWLPQLRLLDKQVEGGLSS